MLDCPDRKCLCQAVRTVSPAKPVDPPQRLSWLRNKLNLIVARRVARRMARAQTFRSKELLRLLRLLEGPASFHDQPRDVVDCIARVALAICRGGGDHLGDSASIHVDFVRLIRLAFDRE
jgi:hypothetical protein